MKKLSTNAIKKSKKITTCAMALLLLSMSACRPTPPAADPVPTNTPSPTMTNTPAPTATNTPAPTATNTPVPTATNTPAPTATNTPVPTIAGNTLTGLTAFEITDRMIIGWNLGNVLDSHGSGISYDTAPGKAAKFWGNEEPTQELFSAVKAGGFNTVRIPTTWYQHVKYDSSKGKYIINEDWLAYVKQTVDYAYDLDMFVILNVHHEDWVNVAQFTDATYATAEAMLTDIWAQVAETFADYDQHLIFEGMNEPRQTGLGSSVEWGTGDAASRKYINDLNHAFVTTIRNQGSKANAERLLMLPGYCASSSTEAIKAIEVPENSGNIALSVHAYYPYFFAMDTSDKANHNFPGKSGWGEDYETAINNLFRNLKNISSSKNVPIIIGECGASDFNNTDSRVRWATYFLTKAKDAGIPCVFWDNQATYNGTGEAYGLICRSTQTWFPNSLPVVQAMMEVYGQESVLPAYVPYVKPAFDWSNIPIESDWIELFRSDNGTYIGVWGNMTLSDWKPYVSKNYDIILVYESEAEPYMVLQGGWHKVFSSETGTNPYMIRFTFDDVNKTLTNENVKLNDMYNYFVSASFKEMTVYGVYAVPVK